MISGLPMVPYEVHHADAHRHPGLVVSPFVEAEAFDDTCGRK